MRKKAAVSGLEASRIHLVALALDGIPMEKPLAALPTTRETCMSTMQVFLDSLVTLLSPCGEHFSDLVRELIRWYFAKWTKDYLSSSSKRNIKPSGPSCQTFQSDLLVHPAGKSADVVDRFLRQNISFGHPRADILASFLPSTIWCLFSSCGYFLAHQIKTKRKNP